MADENKIKELPFDDPTYLDELKQAFVGRVALLDQTNEAYWLARNIERHFKQHPEFPQEHPDLYAEYSRMMIFAKFIALHRLREQEVVELFREHFREIFELVIDIKRKFILKLRTVILFDERDKLREQVYHALLKNESTLVDTPVMNVKTGEQLRRVRQFLGDYVKALGVDRVDKLKVNEFLVKSYDIEHLPEDVQTKIRTLFDFLEYLKISSWEWESEEEPLLIKDESGLKVIRGDQTEDVETPDIKKVVEELKKYGLLKEEEEVPEGEGGMAAAESLQQRWADFTAGERFREVERKRKELGETLNTKP